MRHAHYLSSKKWHDDACHIFFQMIVLMQVRLNLELGRFVIMPLYNAYDILG